MTTDFNNTHESASDKNLLKGATDVSPSVPSHPSDFNLSEKIIPPTCHKNYENIRIEHVKQAVKLLKEKQYVWITDNTETGEGHYQISPIGIFIKVEDLDKIFGDKLI